MTAIYVSNQVHSDVLSGLAETGNVYLGYGPQAVRYDDVRDEIDAVMLRTETFTAEMITGSPKLKIIARHGVGSDNVDIPAATEHGVWVTVTPGQNSQAVAEHVFALALALSRKVVTAATATSGGSWSTAEGQPGRQRTEWQDVGFVWVGQHRHPGREDRGRLRDGSHRHQPFPSPATRSLRPAAARSTWTNCFAAWDVISFHIPLSAGPPGTPSTPTPSPRCRPGPC